MSRSSARGQTEPLAALVAVAAVCLALSLYAGALDSALPGASDRDVARVTLDRVDRNLSPAGVVRPSRIDAAAAPEGYHLNLTLAAGGARWAVGPTPPRTADTARDGVPVRLGPARIRPGVLRVAVWR